MITRWITALINFAAGFAAASVLFLLAPTKDNSRDNDEELETLETLEKTLGEVEKELKELETEINELAPAVEEENK